MPTLFRVGSRCAYSFRVGIVGMMVCLLFQFLFVCYCFYGVCLFVCCFWGVSGEVVGYCGQQSRCEPVSFSQFVFLFFCLFVLLGCGWVCRMKDTDPTSELGGYCTQKRRCEPVWTPPSLTITMAAALIKPDDQLRAPAFRLRPFSVFKSYQ